MTIKRLSPELANQIAAGEVVERPAAVIKELLENSIDAGATSIDIELENGGLRLIKICDNGRGIVKDELALALERHATSKITSLTDLEQIRSLGFRGEALASVSAVSRLCLTSKPAAQAQAWQVRVEGQDQLPVLAPAAHPEGTTVEVRDLFFNTPVRRKFLRSERTELGHIEEMLRRFALSHFNVELRLRNNKQELLRLSPALTTVAQEQRVAKILSHGFLDQALAIETTAEGLKLTGWIAQPSFARSQNDYQFVYLNQRHVRDRLLNHAIRQAYQDKLYEGRQPAYVLYLEIDPTLVDVNVHPTKHEVRFRESRLVHDFVFRALFEALETPASDPIPAVVKSTFSYAPPPLETVVSAAPFLVREEQREYLKPSLFELPEKRVSLAPPLPLEVEGWGEGLKPLGLAHQRYQLIETESGLLILDLLLAQQIILTQQLLTAHETQTLQSQFLTTPLTVRVTTLQTEFCEKNQTVLQALGFDIEVLSAQDLIIRAQPAGLPEPTDASAVLALLATLQTTADPVVALKAFVPACAKMVYQRRSPQKLYQTLQSLPRSLAHTALQAITLTW